MTRRLREGFTTGTAAAAAAKAAVMRLGGCPVPSVLDVPLPPVPESAGLLRPGSCRRLEVPVDWSAAPETRKPEGRARVVKDGGDDPDATHGMNIEAVASRDAPPHWGPPLRLAGLAAGRDVLLYAGAGIGRVTLPGLPVPPGEPAINPHPRRQIAAAVQEAMRSCAMAGTVHVLLSAPDGAQRATRTLNARLGIVGGISILGTQGTVRPFSHEAWKAAVAQGLDVAAATGCRTVLLATGRRSERALFSLYPDLPTQAGVQAADFAAFSLEAAAVRGFSLSVWGCFPGKLLKLARGLEYTHARKAPPDMRLIAAAWQEAAQRSGLPLPRPGELEDVVTLPTAAGALDLVERHSRELFLAVVESLACRAFEHLLAWWSRGAPVPRAGLRFHVFDLEGRLLCTREGDARP